MKNETEFRRLVLLFCIKANQQMYLEKMDPLNYEEDKKFLEEKGYIKDLKLTPNGEKLVNRFTPRERRRIKRCFLGN